MCCSILTDFKTGVRWKVGLLKRFHYFYLFLNILFGVFVCALTHMMFGGVGIAPQKRISDPLRLKVQPVVNHLVWVLGTELGSFRKVKNTHNCWAMFLHHFCFEICVHVCAWMWVCAHEWNAKRSRKRALDPQELDLEEAVCWKLNSGPLKHSMHS